MTAGPSAKIIFESPAEEDAFAGKGHQRLAEALADAISQLSEVDGAIGLEGQWGSGKSTVIRLAAQALTKTDRKHQYQVFSFDLWAHHSNSFRRAFLEEFVTWLDQTSLLTPSQVERHRDIIRDRRKRIRSENKRKYTLWGTLLIFSLPFLPLAYAWMGPGAFQTHQAPVLWGQSLPRLVLYLLFLFVLVPIGIFIFNARSWWLGGFRSAWVALRLLFSKLPFVSIESPSSGSWPNWRTFPRWSSLIAETLRIFSRDVQEDEIIQNIRDEDPTTAEFFSVFRSLLSNVQKDGQRVVFVLDNIDRLPQSVVPLVWAEIRAVFSTGVAGNSEKTSTVTAVVPYDRAHIIPAFTESAVGGNGKAAPRRDTDLFSKTFSRILRVSPPVATDWKVFLDSCITQAFDDQLDDDCRYKLFRILQLNFLETGEHPTPRRIISYVNEIGSFWTQWGNDIPAESIALFVLHREKIEGRADALKDTELVDARYLHAVDQGDWRRHFAALVFNVELDRANQVLLGSAIEKALTSPDEGDLLELSKLDGFEEVLAEFLPGALEGWASEDVELVSRAATNIAKLEPSGELGKMIWREAGATIRNFRELGRYSTEDLPGLLRVLERQGEAYLLETGQALRNAFSQGVEGDNPSQFHWGQIWADSIADICDVIGKINGPKAAEKFWASGSIPGSADFCVGVADQCSIYDDYRFRHLVRSVPINGICDALESRLESDTQAFHDALKEIISMADGATRQKWLGLIANSLRSTKREGEQLQLLLGSYVRLDSSLKHNAKSPQVTTLQALIADGTLVWYAHAARDSDHRSTAYALWLIVKLKGHSKISPAPDPHPALGELSPAAAWYSGLHKGGDLSEEIEALLADLVSRNGVLTQWLQYAADASEAVMFGSVVDKVIEDSKFEHIDLATLIFEYESIRDCLDETHTRLLLARISVIADEQKINGSVPDEKLGALPPTICSDIAAVASGSTLALLLKRVDEYLDNLSEEQWFDALATEDAVVGLLIVRRESQGKEMPAHNFLPAVRENTLEALKGNFEPQKYSEQWDAVVSALKPNTLKKLAMEITKELERTPISTEGALTILRHYRSLAMEFPLPDFADAAIDTFVTAVVRSGNPIAMEFVEERASDIRACMQKASEQIVQTFGELVDDLAASSDEARREFGLKIAQVLQIHLHVEDEGGDDDEPDEKKENSS
ncbi:MAG: P-loop NTPase fold protein [Parvibaculum sp.]|uniref:P-loop NTPase fold protein n=1 Tax=Parvibaculum sp. TaxID=2024848 RepID=UPI0032EFB489